jgi:glucuronate isomerase
MQSFINDDFLLQSDAAKELYHQHAEHQPIIDYHCHLNPEYIANDHQFDNLGKSGSKAIITNVVQCGQTHR